jgi:hypothetical protein
MPPEEVTESYIKLVFKGQISGGEIQVDCLVPTLVIE